MAIKELKNLEIGEYTFPLVGQVEFSNGEACGEVFNTHGGGAGNSASGLNSHAEGHNTTADGAASHTEGNETETEGCASHAEGYGTSAKGEASHAEGYGTTAEGRASHTEGYDTRADGNGCHSEGKYSVSGISLRQDLEGNYIDDNGQIVEDENLRVYSHGAHAEGISTTAYRDGSHAEGRLTHAEGIYSHAEGELTFAKGNGSHAEGLQTTADSNGSHAEGAGTNAIGLYSHAEGYLTVAGLTDEEGEKLDKNYKADNYAGAHAEGQSTQATGKAAHSEGANTIASGNYSHAEGHSTHATNERAHAQGDHTEAKGWYSHAAGRYTIANGRSQTVIGECNITNGHPSEEPSSKHPNDYAFIVGNGTGNGVVRSNAHTLDWSGNAWFAGNIRVGGTGWDNGSPIGGGRTQVISIYDGIPEEQKTGAITLEENTHYRLFGGGLKTVKVYDSNGNLLSTTTANVIELHCGSLSDMTDFGLKKRYDWDTAYASGILLTTSGNLIPSYEFVTYEFKKDGYKNKVEIEYNGVGTTIIISK